MILDLSGSRDAQLPAEQRMHSSRRRTEHEKFLSSRFYPLCAGPLSGLGGRHSKTVTPGAGVSLRHKQPDPPDLFSIHLTVTY